MDKKQKKKVILGSISLVVITAILTTFAVTRFLFGGDLADYKAYMKLTSLQRVIDSEFYKKPNQKKLQEGMAKGLFYGLDDVYSAYYNKEEMKQLLETTSGKYVGVGLVVGPDEDTGAIKVVQVFENGPSSKAGIEKGDLILAINDVKYAYDKMDIAVKKMRGEANTKVKISLLRKGKTLDKEVTRQEIKLESIKSKVVDKDIGYIQIISFDENTDKDFEKALDGLLKKNIKGLIIDVRDNGGGYLDVVKNISDRLLGESVIVYTKDNKGHKEYLRSSEREKVDLPMVILTNSHSASASEILTGALLDNKAAVSVGTTTYGKGLVQSVVKLADGSGFKLTTAQYFTPNGDYINKKGIKPTIKVEDVDKQLPRAIEYLKTKIK